MVIGLFGCSPDYPDAPVDPLAMDRSSTDNDALYCPPETCDNADQESAVFAVPPAQMYEAWLSVIGDAPRTSLIATDPERLLIHAEQRSAIFRFVDTILIRVEAFGEGSSYIALSRSELGQSDLGVNAERLLTWSQTLEKRLGGS